MATHRPLIGVTTQSLHAIEGIPEGLPTSWMMNQRYVQAIAAAGGLPVLIPLLADDPGTLRALYDRIDGLVIPGGVDMDPATYHTPLNEKTGRLDAARDETELLLIKLALHDRKPFLGLCRGLQVLNVALGGTLWQDIATERADSLKHDYFPTQGWSRDHLAHTVEVAADSRLGKILGSGTVRINSMHHQGIRDLAPGLKPSAVAPDGLVEGAEVAGDQYAVAVQWHPEVFAAGAEPVGKLFEDFISAAGH